jgi:transketolase
MNALNLPGKSLGMRNTFIRTLEEQCLKDDDIYIVSGDAGFGVFERFRELKPDRFINVGVAEANMIGYASGLTMTGFNVFVYNIIPFVLYRCYEQVRNDICYQRLPVTLVGIGSGLTYAPGGMTHYSIEDLAICQTLPNLTVISPIDPVETRAAVQYAIQAREPVYIRIAKSGESAIRTDPCHDILEPALIRDGEGVAITAHGSIFPEALEAADSLAGSDIFPRLISIPTLQPFPGDSLLSMIRGCHAIVALEEHYRSGGLTSRMTDFLMDRSEGIKVVPITLPDRFIHEVHTQKGMRQHNGIDAAQVARAVTMLMKKKQGGRHAV